MVNKLNQGTFLIHLFILKNLTSTRLFFSKKRSQLNIYYRTLLFPRQSYSQTTTHYVSVYSYLVFSSKEEEECNIIIHEWTRFKSCDQSKKKIAEESFSIDLYAGRCVSFTHTRSRYHRSSNNVFIKMLCLICLNWSTKATLWGNFCVYYCKMWFVWN